MLLTCGFTPRLELLHIPTVLNRKRALEVPVPVQK